MIHLDNFLLWDDEKSPTRVPRISIDPELFSRRNEEEQWIRVGKWKIKVRVEQNAQGVSVVGKAGKRFSTEASGSMFIDDTMFEVSAADGAKTLGSARGCFEVIW
ncbi:MAG: hypothetical protein AB7J28_06375 [Hyphomonadaceae bacterium]